ncbi:MAG: exosortase/archaeosortase family protein [Thermodesulfobacteriota bacterium]
MINQLPIKRSTLIQLLILAGCFGFLYANTISKLVRDWSTDPNFSHGFLIPPIAAYMLWHKRKELAETPTASNRWGLLVILAGMGLHIVGNVGAELFTMRFSILVTLLGITLYLFGKEITKKALVPILYLLLMIPIPAILWTKIAFPLQLFASWLAADAIQLLSIPVFREGNIIHLANTTLEVVDACSGLRSLTSLLALSGALAYIVPLSLISKWILFLSAVPIAIAVNIFRLTMTAAAAHWIGAHVAEGIVHDMSGLVVFVLAFVLLILTFLLLSKIER